MRVGVTSGLLLALYAVYIELKFSNDADFVASCDISEYISCTEVLSVIIAGCFRRLELLKVAQCLICQMHSTVSS